MVVKYEKQTEIAHIGNTCIIKGFNLNSEK